MNATNITPRILRAKQLSTYLQISVSTLYDWRDAKSPRYKPDFPLPVRMGASSVGWLREEIDNWLQKNRMQ